MGVSQIDSVVLLIDRQTILSCLGYSGSVFLEGGILFDLIANPIDRLSKILFYSFRKGCMYV